MAHETAGFVEELWGELENPLLDRLELAREAAVVVLGTKQSGKSTLLLGTKSADDPAFYARSDNGGSEGRSLCGRHAGLLGLAGSAAARPALACASQRTSRRFSMS